MAPLFAKVGETMLRALVVLLLLSTNAHSGDDASGDIPREMDLRAPHGQYTLTELDFDWSRSLVQRFKYDGEVVHFARTSIALISDGQTIEGRVYQSLEYPDMYYVAEGDLIFVLGREHPYSPGVGGFSMHAPPSGNFIVCLNCLRGGVPSLDSSKVHRGVVKWRGARWNRF